MVLITASLRDCANANTKIFEYLISIQYRTQQLVHTGCSGSSVDSTSAPSSVCGAWVYVCARACGVTSAGAKVGRHKTCSRAHNFVLQGSGGARTSHFMSHGAWTFRAPVSDLAIQSGHSHQPSHQDLPEPTPGCCCCDDCGMSCRLQPRDLASPSRNSW